MYQCQSNTPTKHSVIVKITMPASLVMSDILAAAPSVSDYVILQVFLWSQNERERGRYRGVDWTGLDCIMTEY